MAMEPETREKIASCLDIAAAESGRPLAELRDEYWSLAHGPGRLMAAEYLRFGLHHTGHHSDEAKRQFLSERLHWPIVERCCDMTWLAVSEDKWLAARLLDAAGIATPRILAVTDESQRHYPGSPVIRSEDQFRGFLRELRGQPFFAKPIRGFGSRGIFRCEWHDGTHMRLTRMGEVAIGEVYRDFIAERPYVFQPVVRNHEFLDGITRTLATLRTGVVVYDNGVRLASCFLKMAGGDNLEDRFFVAGNYGCPIDLRTGEIRAIRRRTEHGYATHPVHPESGRPMVGTHVPFWPQVLEMVGIAARVFAPLRYQTMDIALTPRGPVTIEINTGGGFSGPQMALEQGLLGSEFGSFLAAMGIEMESFPAAPDPL